MGDEYSYYIKKDENDNSFEDLKNFIINRDFSNDFKENKKYKILLNNKIKKMQKRILRVRYKKNENKVEYIDFIESLNLYLTFDNNYNSEIGFIKEGESIL